MNAKGEVGGGRVGGWGIMVVVNGEVKVGGGQDGCKQRIEGGGRGQVVGGLG